MAEAQAGAATRPLRSEKGIEDFADVFCCDARTIVREYESNFPIGVFYGNLQRARARAGW